MKKIFIYAFFLASVCSMHAMDSDDDGGPDIEAAMGEVSNPMFSVVVAGDVDSQKQDAKPIFTVAVHAKTLCCICQSFVGEGSPHDLAVVRLGQPQHSIFHFHCMAKQANTGGKCPTCRESMIPEDFDLEIEKPPEWTQDEREQLNIALMNAINDTERYKQRADTAEKLAAAVNIHNSELGSLCCTIGGIAGFLTYYILFS